MRNSLYLTLLLFVSSLTFGQVTWQPAHIPSSKLSAKQLSVVAQQGKARIASTSCMDTSLYPQSKQSSSANTVPMYDLYIEGIYQTYYNADSLWLNGISMPGYLDADFILGNTPSVKLIASAYTLNKNYATGACYPGTLIDSVHYTMTDNNNGVENIMFNSPLAIADSFVIIIDMDSAHLANKDTVFFLTNNTTNNDGNGEKLSGSAYLGIYYNNFQDIGGWDVDMYLNPIVTHKVTTNYQMSASAICPADSISFTNNTVVNGSRMFNTHNGTTMPLHTWDFGPAGTSSTTSPVVNFTTSGTHTVKLVSTVYGSTGNCADSTTTTVFISDSAWADFGSTIFGGVVQFSDSSTGATSWTWDFGDGSPNSNAQNPLHTYTTNGAFSVCLIVSDSLGCTSDTLCDSIQIIAAGLAKNTDVPLNVFPNPMNEQVQLQVPIGYAIGTVRISDISGRVLHHGIYQNNQTNLDVSAFPKGVYILSCSDGVRQHQTPLIKN